MKIPGAEGLYIVDSKSRIPQREYMAMHPGSGDKRELGLGLFSKFYSMKRYIHTDICPCTYIVCDVLSI
jgi:hypothetical protein